MLRGAAGIPTRLTWVNTCEGALMEYTGVERRNVPERAARVRMIINAIVVAGDKDLSANELRGDLPLDGFARIMARLVAAGIVEQQRDGVWRRKWHPTSEDEHNDCQTKL